MNYRILWLQSALDDLTKIWTDSPSPLRQAITKASHAVDMQLVINPEEQGESRPKGRRIGFFPPLGITFRVDVQNATVVVIHIWCFREHAK